MNLTQGNEILVDTPESAPNGNSLRQASPDTALISWVMSRTERWKDQRNMGYAKRWQEYWRLWRGRWDPSDKNRQAERSRIIAPALSQAIESTVAEIEEATLSKDQWIDVSDDVADEETLDQLIMRDTLLEDLGKVTAKESFSEVALNAAIFGTGIVKINVDVILEANPVRNQMSGQLERNESEVVAVYPESVRPDEFIPDPTGRNIHEMLGVAHEISVPRHKILEKIQRGVYRREALPNIHGIRPPRDGWGADANEIEQMFMSPETDSVTVTEYHGKVPLKMLRGTNTARTPVDMILEITKDESVSETDGEGPLVEAIVTIANGNTLLRAIETPFLMKDRSFVAYQFERIPGRFWGRGIAEKGFNPQKALDAEIRSRIDALGYISSPMMGVDASRVPRGFKMNIHPGKVWKTNGKPSEALEPLKIGTIDGATWNHSSEMERMVQMATGQYDTAQSLGQQSSTSGANAASTNSLMMGSFVKRSKRAVQSFTRQLLQPSIKKILWRYMQFYPTRYPEDFKFKIVAGMGIVAREVEAVQLTQLLGMMPDDFPEVSVVVAKGIIDNSAVYNKAEIIQAIDKALEPPPEEEVKRQQALQEANYEATLAQAQGALLANQKTLAEIREILTKAEVNARKADTEDIKAQQEQERIALEAEKVRQFEEQNEIAMERLRLQAEDLRMKRQEQSNNNK